MSHLLFDYVLNDYNIIARFLLYPSQAAILVVAVTCYICHISSAIFVFGIEFLI